MTALDRPTLWSSFKRAQVASLIATCLDFGTLVGLTEWAKLWYVASTAIASLVGACTHFTLGRYWCFMATHGDAVGQAVRYFAVAAAAIALNSVGVWYFTEHWHIPYMVSRLMTGFLVGIGFNFPLHRHFVFR